MNYSTKAGRTIPGRDFVIVWSVVTLLLILIGTSDIAPFLQPLRLLLGLLFILFLPGYSLTTALYPQHEALDSVQRFALSVGLSIATVSVLALLLDRLPWGIHLWSILIGEIVVIALATVVALLRRNRLPTDDIYYPTLALSPTAWWRSRPVSERRILSVLMVLMLLASILFTWMAISPSPAERMTEFYLLAEGGGTDGFPDHASSGEALSLNLGIVNRERAVQTYRVEVWVEDTWAADRRMLVVEVEPRTIIPNAGIKIPVTWRMPWSGDDQMVEFLLFDGEQDAPLRRLSLWLNVDP